jgi:Ca2+-binding EF-hand superfamily protein
MELARFGPQDEARVRLFTAICQSRVDGGAEMKTILSLFAVCLMTTTAAAQFGGKNGAALRNSARPTETTQKKTASDKGHPGKANAEDQAAAETELVNAILLAMDADKDGVVSKMEYGKALAALRKVHKDKQGNMVVPENATPATPGDPKAAAEAGPGQAGAGPAVGAGNRNNNEAMARFMQYDTNHDGVLSPNEVPPQARAMLRGADFNNDGVIDAKELQEFARKMGERMKAFSGGVNPNGPGVPGEGRQPKP